MVDLILTFYEYDEITRLRRFRFNSNFYNGFSYALRNTVDMVEWFDQQPIAKIFLANEISYAVTDKVKSSFILSNLTDDQATLVKLFVGKDIGIRDARTVREKIARGFMPKSRDRYA